MGHYNRERDYEELARQQLVQTRNEKLNMETGFDWLVRGLGIVLVVAGMWSAIMVIAETWTLYSDPQRIERFAQAIEKGSNLDKALSAPSSDASDPESFRLSYFAAWIFALPLLFLIGLLALQAVTVGVGLARPERKSKSLHPPPTAAADLHQQRDDSAEPSRLRLQR